MATKVVDFLNESGGSNFTESAPRPPTYGEENELQSNGGNSTKSSNSHKSHGSNKSHSSTKSVASAKGDHVHSPASTPRKSNLEGNRAADSMTGTVAPAKGKYEDGEAVAAPLGFEPEGSAANSPHSEGTPPHSKWAESLRCLLEDSEGVALFRDYMDHELPGGSEELQFWFACQGLKKTIINSKELDHSITNIQKVIYKRYVRSDKVRSITKTVKRDIAEKVSNRNVIDPCIFDSAQEEVEKSMQSTAYPSFLASHYYTEYLHADTDSPKSSPSSGSDSARPVSQTGLLPVVHEDKELKNEDLHASFQVPVMNKGSSTGKRAPSSSSLRHAETVTGSAIYPLKRPYYPTHISYAPVSAQDSELQSLSSDALTDDTMSVTDGSVDGGRISSKKHIKYAWKVLASENRETATGLNRSIVPRTHHPPKDSQMAQNNPNQFSALLIEKLTRIVEERESTARMEEKIHKSEERSVTTFAKANTSASFMPLSTTMEEETAESILDQHCSRIWESSNHDTPSYSPPRPSSPPYRSPDRHKDLRSKALVHPPGLSPAAYAPRSSHKKREFVTYDIDDRSMLVSGTTETHRHIHYHHYHHHRDSLKKAHVDYDTQTSGVSAWRTENLQNISSELPNPYYANRGRTHTRKNSSNVLKKTSDSCSNFDSGISVMDSVKTASMNWGHPASEKVMKWMMNTDIVQEVSATVQDMEKSSSTHRHSHRLNQSATSTQQIKTCSRSKSAAVRSASVDRTGGSLSLWTGATPAVPGQQPSQDASLCLFATPNSIPPQSRTAAVAAASPLKSRSFTSVPPKDRMRTPLSGISLASTSHNRTLPPTRTVPSHLDSSSANQSFDIGLRASANTTSLMQNNTETIIGIYMGQEPIPYRHQLPGRAITLAQIKSLLTKKGPFRYYFKRHSDEFGDGAGAVFEEISDNSTIVPLWQGKIVVKVEKMD
ncbi:unnamed protein product [Candidula unifasciata]|uniref:Axin-1 n=1 Tax=Candidula unifasciata TaxID=100452 RepID=A0A8S3YDN7_9EUPU|nr:unnamed protein product [Candidula unifasciata]